MLACRLCLSFGEQDPEQWLERCPRRVLNIWRAFSVAEGWFTERHLAAQSAIALRRLMAMKYKPSHREQMIKSLFDEAQTYLPFVIDREEERQELDPSILATLAKEVAQLSSEVFSTEASIEGDLWQPQ